MPPPKKRKLTGHGDGGCKQPVLGVASATQESGSRINSKLADHLISMIFWGFMSVAMAQTIAQLAIVDGAAGQNLQTLADLGSSGRYKGNVWRDLLRRIKFGFVDAARVLVSMPLQIKEKVTPMGVSMLLPHKLFHIMFTHNRSEFIYRLCGGSIENITLFWEDMRGHPSYPDHQLHRHRKFDFKTKGIPLRLHGDGVTPIACGQIWAQSVQALSWSSCLSPRIGSWITNFLIIFIYESMIVQDQTMEVVFAQLAWSLYWLERGEWPDRCFRGILYTTGIDFARKGTPLAGGFFGILWIIRNDLEWIVKRLRVPDYRSNDCILCPAGNYCDLPWSDCRTAALWIPRTWTPVTWAAQFLNPHHLFLALRLSILVFAPDPLHTKYIGTDGYFLGGVLRYLTHHLLMNNPDANLSQVIKELGQAYDDLGIHAGRFSVLKHTSIQSESSKLPYLKGNGYALKQMTKALQTVFELHVAKARPMGRLTRASVVSGNNLITLSFKYSIAIDTLLDRNIDSNKLDDADSKALVSATFGFAQTQTALIKLFHPVAPVFHYTLKKHYLLHIALVSKYINPNMASCCEGEDMMKLVKRLIQSSSSGNTPHGCAQKAMARYCKALGFDLTRRAVTAWRRHGCLQ